MKRMKHIILYSVVSIKTQGFCMKATHYETYHFESGMRVT